MKEIVFILAPGRSGTTVFSKFLGMNSRCFSLSEPKVFDIEIENDSICSCGKHYSHCPFWIKIQRSIQDEDFTTSIRFNSPDEGWVKKALKTANVYLFLKTGFPFLFKEHDRVMQNNARLLRTINSQIDEDVIIDGSKDILRALYLSRLLKNEFTFKYVILIRDPKANVFSKMKNQYKVTLNKQDIEGENVITSNDPNRMEFHEAINNWNVSVKRILQLIRLFKLPHVSVIYERFATDPEKAFNEISPYLGLAWEDSMLDLDSKEHHLLGGNSSRLNAKFIHKPKEEWKNLSTHEIDEIENKTRAVYEQLTSTLTPTIYH